MSDRQVEGTEPEPATVLVVVDNRPLTSLYAGLLADTFHVRTANGGDEALDQLDDTVDVVLLDRRMPELSGDEVLAHIRARGLDTRVALVTAVDPEIDVFESGFDAHVTKPVHRDTLHETVETLVRRSSYSERVSEYFALVEKKAVLEAANGDAELAESPEYRTLATKVEDLGAELERLEMTFDNADFVVLFRDFDSHRPAGGGSTASEGDSTEIEAEGPWGSL